MRANRSIFFLLCATAMLTHSAGKQRFSQPLVLYDRHNKVVSGLTITGAPGNCIRLVNCSNIVVRDCVLRNAGGNAIDLENCSGIRITACTIENVGTGVYALSSSGIIVDSNTVKNVKGPFPRGQMVQFNGVSGNHNRITNNRFESIDGKGRPEDAINLYRSSGMAGDPILISGNRIRGGGPSKKGGGIMLGDGGGNWQKAERNVLVDPGQYGVAIAGGTNHVISENTIYARQKAFTNVGIYVWNQDSTDCASHTISGNRVNWTNSSGNKHPFWDGNNCRYVRWSANDWNAQIGSWILPVQLIPGGS